MSDTITIYSMLPKVTFSILCYNYGKYLDQAIRSCLDQSYKNCEIEVLVINDGSTDNTEEICARYQGQIKVINEGNKGFPSSLTRAIKYATGNYVFLLDADDYFLNGKLSAFLPHFLEGKLFVHDGAQPLYSSECIHEQIVVEGGCTSTIAVNRLAALDLLPVENEVSFHILNKMGHGVTLDNAYTVYRIHNDSMTNRKEPGIWNTYLAGVTHRLTDRIEEILQNQELPPWFLPKHRAEKVAANFRSLAYYNELEAALECEERLKAYKAFLHMIKFALLTDKGIEIMHLKMLLKTLLGKPSFRKSRNKE